MGIVWAIIICILLGYFWIRLIQHIFIKQKKKLSWKLFLTSFFIVGSLLAFSFLVEKIFPEINVAENWIISLTWWSSFLFYCGVIFLFLIIINGNLRKKQIWFLFITRILLFAIVGFFGLKIWISTTVLYYFLLAYAEEFLKIWATENEVSKSEFYSSDLLYLSIFISLWFSIIENLFYLGNDILFGDNKWIWWLVFWRWIFTSLLHFIATWLIALLLYKLYQQKHLKNLNISQKIIRIIIAILIWVLIHWWYNLSIQHTNLLIYIILVFGWYFLLTYLLFLSDSLYKTNQ